MDDAQLRQLPAPQAPARNKNFGHHPRGPRKLCLTRRESGFGFTLRHFIVYPPETYRLFGREDARPDPDQPMETIFVKGVNPGSAAQEAGLSTGDRLLSVNGEQIECKSYAYVVQTIQNCPDRLYLVVVPKEHDVIQQFYSMTAHHPKTNPRPRLRSPDVVGHARRDSSPGAHRPVPATAEPIYHTPSWTDRSSSGSWSSTPRRLSEINEPVISMGAHNPHGALPAALNLPGCRLSLDGSRLSSSGGSIKSFESGSTLTDDSQIMSRIRRSCEQKEEFLRSHVTPVYAPRVTPPVTEAREFYGRPQRMAQPQWPPPPEERGRTPLRPLGRIHEGATVNNARGFGANSFDSDPGELVRPPKTSTRSRSEEKELVPPVHRTLTAPLVQMVSTMAKQFESGQLEEDRVNMYRSELSRLSGKHTVPNVAVRRQEYEQRNSQERSPRVVGMSPPPLASYTSPLSGNRTVPVGSSQLHAVPPEGYRDLSAASRIEERRRRGRSVSTERWSSLDENQSPRLSTLSPANERRVSRLSAPDENQLPRLSPLSAANDRRVSRLSPPLDKQRHKAVRQDSYLAAVKTIPGPTASRARRVVRRQPSLDSADLEKLDLARRDKPRMRPRKLSLRPISPLVLTDHDDDYDDVYQVPTTTVPITTTADSSSIVRRAKASSLTVDERTTRRVSYLRATLADRGADADPDVPEPIKSSARKWLYPMLPGEILRLRRIFEESPMPTLHGEEISEKKEDVIKEGWLHYKMRTNDGKRAHDRSWKQIYAVLRASLLALYKDRRIGEIDTVDIKGSIIDVAADYKKRSNVLRVRTPGDSEYLLQAEDATDMEQWRRVLQSLGEAEAESADSQSPACQSPVSKTRKASQPAQGVDPMPSPKSKTWKGKLGKPFWRMQGASSPSSPTYPEGATIGVPLDQCPPSTDNVFVPLLVSRCTAVVEELGLDIVGVYRVPGNTAQISALTDAVNKLGIHNVPLEDPRWKEVNVISSLLKSFFRNLPDPLFTSDLYPTFIAADKIPDQLARMAAIRKLMGHLPQHNYETLKHVLYHLQKVVKNSAANRMESRNLAIVFGPTLLRATELLTLVQDTAHQCRIVESLVTHVDWFYSDDNVDCLETTTLPPCAEGAQLSETPHSASLLLNNLSKVGGYTGDQSPNRDLSRKDIMSSIINAASRKTKSKPKKPEKVLPPFGQHLSKSKDGHAEMTAASNLAACVLPGVVTTECLSPGAEMITQGAEPGPQQPGVHAHDPATLERIRRFEIETQAMLTRDPARMRRATDWRNTDNRTFDTHTTKTDLNTSSKELLTLTRKVGSCESLHDDVTSLKRFKSSREDCSSNKFGSLDSLQAGHTDDGHDLVVSLTKTFDQKMQVLKSSDESESSGAEKAEKETQKSKEEEKDKDSLEENEKNKNDTWKQNAETWKEWEARILTPYNGTRVKRSESLNKTDKPDTGPKVRRSESLGKADIRRTDSLTKTEKTETNMKAKLKRSSSKEKENSVARLKRIKRRHTVGGTKDLDKLPWLDNRLYTEAMERQANKQRTSSPDLTTPKLRNSITNELISLGVEEETAAKAAQLVTPTVSRPKSMPPPLESQL